MQLRLGLLVSVVLISGEMFSSAADHGDFCGQLCEELFIKLHSSAERTENL